MSGNKKIKINRRLGNPITTLVLSLDSSNLNSYSGLGSNWYDLTTYANNVSFINNLPFHEPTFSSENSGIIVFDGNNYGTINDNLSLEFVNGMFTVEIWIKFSELRGYQGIISKPGYSDGNGFMLYLENNNTITAVGGDNGWQVIMLSNIVPVLNKWYHLVVTKSNLGVWSLYINDSEQSIGDVNNTTFTFPDNDTNMYIGTYTNFPGYSNQLANNLYGSIGKVRIWKGYCMSPTIVSVNYSIGSIRFNNDGKIEIDDVELKTTLFNGTLYSSNTDTYTFDGDDDYAILTNAPKPTTEMTISAWVKLNEMGSWRKAVCFPYGVDSFYLPFNSYQISTGDNNNLNVMFNVNPNFNGALYYPATIDTWYQVVGSFNNGIIKMYVNGELVDTLDVTQEGTSIQYTERTDLLIGQHAEYYLSQGWNGQVSDVKIFTTELSSIDILNNFNLTKSNYGFTTTTTTTNNNSQNNYSLILNFEGNFEDNSGNNLVPTVIGNPTFSSDSVLGSGSMLIESSGAGLSYTSNSLFNFGNGDFTIETWVKFSNTDDSQALFTNYSSWGYSSIYFGRHPGTSGKVSVWCYNGTNLVTLQEVEMTTNEWVHYALVKNGTSLVLYKNGINVSNTSITSTSWNYDFSVYVGFAGDDPSGYGLIGNLDSYKISKVARYTSNFTPEGYVEPITTTTTTTTAAPTTTTTTTTTSTGSLILNLDAGNTSSYPGTGTTWTDLTNTYSGISLVNGALYNSDGGGNILLDGVNDYIDLGLIGVMPNKNKFTFNTVYRFDKSKGGNAIFSAGTNGDASTDILFAHDGNVFFFQINNGSDGSAVANYTYTSNTWVNICVVYDGTQTGNANRLKVYFDGVQNTLTFGSYTVPASTPNYNYQSYLGKYVSFSGWDLKGNIAITRLHNYALSSTEVSSFYTSIQSRF